MHSYDRGGSYLAGAAGLELGVGRAEHHPDGRAFDPKLPGYWRIEVPDAADWRLPHPLTPTNSIPAGPVWVSTPTLQLGYQNGYDVPVLEAYTWPEHLRILDPWYERVRDARTALDIDDAGAQAARGLVKLVAVATIGIMGSHTHLKGKVGYAPERRHHIVGKARANIWRRVAQIGRDSDVWPVAAATDTVLYASDDPDPVSAWPGKAEHYGRGLGQFKWEGSALLAEHLPHLTGKGYRVAPGGQRLLSTDWDPSSLTG